MEARKGGHLSLMLDEGAPQNQWLGTVWAGQVLCPALQARSSGVAQGQSGPTQAMLRRSQLTLMLRHHHPEVLDDF